MRQRGSREDAFGESEQRKGPQAKETQEREGAKWGTGKGAGNSRWGEMWAPKMGKTAVFKEQKQDLPGENMVSKWSVT